MACRAQKKRSRQISPAGVYDPGRAYHQLLRHNFSTAANEWHGFICPRAGLFKLLDKRIGSTCFVVFEVFLVVAWRHAAELEQAFAVFKRLLARIDLAGGGEIGGVETDSRGHRQDRSEQGAA